MDNILFVPATHEMEWVQEVLPGTSPAELPIAGRRAIDYCIESAQKFGVLFYEILDWRFSEKLADDFSDLARSGRPIFYLKGEGAVPKGLKAIEGYSSPLTGNLSDGLVVAWGMMLSTHGRGDVTLEPITEEERENTPAGLYRREGGRWMRILPQSVVMRGVREWHELNFTVLHNPDKFTVPGYSSEHGVHIGRNVVMEHGTRVKPTVLLQDNTWLARNVCLDGDVVVDSGSYISEGARLKRTVVLANTFVGEGLELDNKIVAGRRVIDAETGTWVDLEEPGLARRIPAGLGWVRSVWHFLRGRSMGRRG